MKRWLRIVCLSCLLTGSNSALAQESDDAPTRLRAPEFSTGSTEKSTVEIPKLTVARIHFRGNRKVEDDALKVHLKTKVGATLNKELLQEDVRAIWRLDYFEDIQVDTTSSPTGLVVTFVVKEKPYIRKIYVSGHEEVGLSKINEVLDLKKEQILDLAKVKKNVEKIRELFLQRGFYMAEVEFELHRDSPGTVDVYFRVRENSKVEIRRINFTGNKSVTDEELRLVVLTQPGDLFSAITSAGTYREDVLQRDVMMVQSYYFDRGYINVKVSEPRLSLSPDRRSMYININIEEGKQYYIGSLDVKGDLLESRETYLQLVKSKQGEIFNRSQVAQDVQNIADRFKDEGYAYVNTVPDTHVDEKKLSVDLVLDIEKGPKVTFDRINIRGNTKTRDKVIRRELRVYEGEIYSQFWVDISKRRVNSLGFFDKVDVTTKRGASNDTMEMNVEVSERQTGAFQIGAGFSSAESFIAQMQISQNNFLGRGTSATANAQISRIRQLYQFQYDDPYFLDTNWTFGFSLFKQQRFTMAFTRSSTGGTLTWGYMLADNLRTYLTYTLQDVGVTTGGRSSLFSGGQRSPLAEGSLANLLHSGISSSWRATVTYDSRDDRMFPKRGWFNTLSAEFAEPAFFSESQFSRYEAAFRYFVPIYDPLILRLKAEGGYITSRDPQGVPIFERYLLGGMYDVRGYQLYSLGPQIRVPGSQDPGAALRTFSIGGNVRVIGKAEIEVPLFEKMNIRGVVFTDIGNSYNLESQYCRLKPAWAHESVDPCTVLFPLSSLRGSWGFGVRWFSPIGPLRFEWGLPIKRLPHEDSMLFEFNIGNEL